MIKKIKEKIYNLLKWSERYTKTDMIYLSKGGFWSLLEKIFSSSRATILAIIFGNFLSPTIYGTYKYIISVANSFNSISLSGTDVAVTQGVARGKEGIFKSAVILNLRWGIAIFIAAFSASIYYFINHNNTLAITLLLVAIVSPITNSLNFYPAFLIGRKLFKEKTHFNTISEFFLATALIIGIFTTHSPIVLSSIYILTTSATAAFFYFYIIKHFKPNNEDDPKLLNFSKHLSLMNVFTTVASYLDKILIFHYLGAVQTAVYTFSLSAPDQITGIIRNPLINLIQPKLSKSSLVTVRHAIIKKTIMLLILLIPIVIIYYFAAPFIFQILFPLYTKSINFSQIYALSILFIPQIFMNEMLNTHGKTRELYWIKLVVNPIKIISLIFLIPKFGILGAIFSILLSKIVSVFILLYIFFKKTYLYSSDINKNIKILP